MNAKHGGPGHPSSPRWVWRQRSSLRRTVFQGVVVYGVSQTRKQPKQWAIDGRHDENLSFMFLIMERSGWLGDNSMRWIVWWTRTLENRSEDRGGGQVSDLLNHSLLWAASPPYSLCYAWTHPSKLSLTPYSSVPWHYCELLIKK